MLCKAVAKASASFLGSAGSTTIGFQAMMLEMIRQNRLIEWTGGQVQRRSSTDARWIKAGWLKWKSRCVLLTFSVPAGPD